MVERAGGTRLFPCVKPQSSLFIRPQTQATWTGQVPSCFFFQFSPHFLIHFVLIKSFHDTIPLHQVLENRTLDQGCSRNDLICRKLGFTRVSPKSGLRPLEGAAICVFNKNTCQRHVSHFRTTSPSVGQSPSLHQHDLTVRCSRINA